jgi:hypothetical protein
MLAASPNFMMAPSPNRFFKFAIVASKAFRLPLSLISPNLLFGVKLTAADPTIRQLPLRATRIPPV